MTELDAAAVERAAIALYEHTREPDYSGPEWDWANIDKSYDWDGYLDELPEGATRPEGEWLRDRYREDARVVLRAALERL